MTELENKQQATIEKLERKIKRLEKRLIEKKKYELGYLMAATATPQLIEKIEAKDRAALAD